MRGDRRPGKGNGLGNSRAANDLDRNKKPSPPQHLLLGNSQIPPMIARHLGIEVVDVDGTLDWSPRLATAAARWLQQWRAA